MIPAELFHLLLDFRWPPSDRNMQSIITGYFVIGPLAPLFVSLNERLSLARNDKIN
jgi:hypothetical protein